MNTSGVPRRNVSKSVRGQQQKYNEAAKNELSSLLSSEAKDTVPNRSSNYGGMSQSCDYNVVLEPSSNTDDGILLSTDSIYLCPEDVLKQKLKYFFMNPLGKWRAKGKFPWKLVLQVVKIIFVTLQLSVFGTDGYTYELQKQHTVASFRHIFLNDWTPIREVVSYPPSTGPYAVYTKPEFYENINNVIRRYAKITAIALGAFAYDVANGTMPGVLFCRKHFKNVSIVNSTLTFNSNIENNCLEIPAVYPPSDPRWDKFSIEDFLKEKNGSMGFNRLIEAQLSFSIDAVFMKSLANYRYPDCYKFHINVIYDNSEHDGQVLVSLLTSPKKFSCKHSEGFEVERNVGYALRQVLNIFIVGIGCLSLVLCCRCLYRGFQLCKQTNSFFRHYQGKPLSGSEKTEFVDGWYCMMVVNDVLIITGSILKACIEQRTVESDQYATCAILLGTGNLLVWAGVLRYLGFFHKYNLLILTLKTAIPNVLRFMLCCFLLYGGFCFCGWVVLGPYHIKFRSLSSTSECLFAMMNGDDLFATFAITDTNSSLIWWFSRIYLYSFISMFIYVVISLFISVIMDSYETIKEQYRNGGQSLQPTRIKAFFDDCAEDSCTAYFRMQRSQNLSMFSKILQCCSRRKI